MKQVNTVREMNLFHSNDDVKELNLLTDGMDEISIQGTKKELREFIKPYLKAKSFNCGFLKDVTSGQIEYVVYRRATDRYGEGFVYKWENWTC